MTRDLLVVTLLFVVIPLICIVITRIYASRTLASLYDAVFTLEGHVIWKFDTEEYVRRYIELVSFRKTFYHFLSNYMREEKFRNYHDFFELYHPKLSKRIDHDFSVWYSLQKKMLLLSIFFLYYFLYKTFLRGADSRRAASTFLYIYSF